MPYITILGAGSTVFARQLITDILQIDGLDEGCFALIDITPEMCDRVYLIDTQLRERTIVIATID